MPSKLSVVITTLNNENRIRKTLESIKWADEIIIVDGGSSDRTIEICREYTDEIFSQPSHPNWDINKNFGFARAKGEWILNLDSDEIISPKLEKEIKGVLRENLEYDCFYIPRRNYFFGAWIKSIWGKEQLCGKLFRKGRAYYECKQLVHESITMLGKIGQLSGHIDHYCYSKISELIKRIDFYSTQEAIQLQKENFHLRWVDFIIRPFRYMFYAYIKKGGFKRGMAEFITIVLWCGVLQFLTIAKLWEIQKNQR